MVIRKRKQLRLEFGVRSNMPTDADLSAVIEVHFNAEMPSNKRMAFWQGELWERGEDGKWRKISNGEEEGGTGD